MKNQIDNKLISYGRRFGNYLDMAKEKLEAQRIQWSDELTVSFGDYATNWENYKSVIMKQEGDTTTRTTLGPAVTSNLGIVSMQFGSMPITPIASVQTLSDTVGNIYFKQGVATMTRGSVSKGDVLSTAFGSINSKVSDYMSEVTIINSPVVLTDPSDITSPVSNGTYDISLGEDINKNSVKINIAGGKIRGMDDGEGHIIGVGIDGETSVIDYTTGIVTLNLLDAPGKGVVLDDIISVTASQVLVDKTNVPGIRFELVPKVVQAKLFIIQSSYTSISQFTLLKRFGSNLGEEAAAETVAQINGGVLYEVVSKLMTAAKENEAKSGELITWNSAAPANISNADYRKTFDDKVIEATDKMYKMCGKGNVNFIITGTKGKQIFKTLGLTIINQGATGVHLCGYHDNVIPVFYAPDGAVSDNDVLIGFRGSNFFEAAVVYSPYLPLTTAEGSVRENVFTHHSGAFHSAGVDVVVPEFVQRIRII